jgi:hypothetical protein
LSENESSSLASQRLIILKREKSRAFILPFPIPFAKEFFDNRWHT